MKIDTDITEQDRSHADSLRNMQYLDKPMLEAAYRDLAAVYYAQHREIGRLNALLNTPETEDFYKGIELEAAHQRQRWPSEQDAGKTPADWFWLVGYLAGKCLTSVIGGDTQKALHHTISTAAALANWHRAIKGAGNMRPGISMPPEATG